jgi:ADP-ribose pyrophosphatase YjhB (NUDIX family)
VVRETAAAAIAVRPSEAGPQVCVVQQGEQWSVPWALLGKGEVPKQTALRALREASGVETTLADVDPRFYRTAEQVYRRGIDKMRREVHFYRVKAPDQPAGGTWLPAAEAVQRVTSKTVRDALEAALASELAGAGKP